MVVGAAGVGGDEEGLVVFAAEAEVGDAHVEGGAGVDGAEVGTVGGEDFYAVGGGGPEASGVVDAEAVGVAGLEADEGFGGSEGAVFVDVADGDGAAVGEVKFLFIG